MSFETISVIGLGYIGLPTAAAFASRKKSVIGVDVNQHAYPHLHLVDEEMLGLDELPLTTLPFFQ